MQEQETIRKDISNRTMAELEGFTLGKEEYLELFEPPYFFKPLHIERIGDKVFLVG
jgi:hypothetical protein